MCSITDPQVSDFHIIAWEHATLLLYSSRLVKAHPSLKDTIKSVLQKSKHKAAYVMAHALQKLHTLMDSEVPNIPEWKRYLVLLF